MIRILLMARRSPRGHPAGSRLMRIGAGIAALLGSWGPALAQLDLSVLPARGGASSALAQFDAAQADEGVRFGLAGALPGQRLVLSGRLHATRPQNLLGSQVLPGNRYRVFSEIGLAYRLRHDLSIGAEYRFDPDNNRTAGPFGNRARDGAWKDLFISWSLSSSVVLTAAHVDLGDLVRTPGARRQTGQYFSAEFRY